MTHASAHEAARQALAKLGIAPATATAYLVHAYLVHDSIDRACPTCYGLGEIIADAAPEDDGPDEDRHEYDDRSHYYQH